MNDRPRKMPTKRSHKKKPVVEQSPPSGVVPPMPAVYASAPEPEPEPERVLPNVKRLIPGRTDNFVLAWIVVAAVTIAFVVWAYVTHP